MRYLLAALLLFAACGPQPPATRWQRVCPEPPTDEHRAWLLQCADTDGASDESEDYVNACAHHAAKMFCPLQAQFYDDGWMSCDHARTKAALNACAKQKLESPP